MKIGKYEIDGTDCIMGILNVTPDSFSDGGSYTSIENALAQAEKMIAGGAKIIDVGGESTRPGYTFVEAEEEINRVVPVISALKERFDVLVSIDTYKTETARAALEAGADILNDVWAGLYDGKMLALAAEKNVPIILMHNQEEEKYDNITKEVCDFLTERAQAALDAGVTLENIFGISRKRTVDYLLGGGTLAAERDMGTAALSAWAVAKGCQIVRVHNVDVNRDIVKVISQLS